MQKALLYFSIAFIVLQLCLVLIPYMRRKRDLVTAWSFFSIGAACFVGFSGIGAVLTPDGYIQNTDVDYLWFFAGVIVFFTCVNVVYFFFKWPNKIAARRFRKWPPATQSVLLFVIPIGLVMSIGLISPLQVQGVGQVMAIVGRNGVIIACIAAFIFWYRQPSNPVSITVMLAVFAYSFGFSMLGGSGRRDMVAVLAAIPIVLYWYRHRYSNPVKTTLYLLAVAIPAILIVNGYTSLRHDLGRSGDKSASALLQAALKIPAAMLDTSGAAQMLGQNAVEVSLLSINVYQTEKWSGFEVEPFHAAKFVLVNPIPRAFWPDKPEGLGRTLPRETDLRGGRETWGPGIVGHAFHEGGLHMLVFYGVLVGVFLRLFDTVLYLHPDNPYLLSMLAANAGHLIGWTRGDIGTFSINIIAGVIAVWAVVLVMRLLCGTQVPALAGDPSAI